MAIPSAIARRWMRQAKDEQIEVNRRYGRTGGLTPRCPDCGLLCTWQDSEKRDGRCSDCYTANQERERVEVDSTATLHHCHMCDRDYPADAFYRDRRRASGVQSKCRLCSHQYVRAWNSRRRLMDRLSAGRAA